ncbi:hypothetical protein AB395_00003917 [Sinorhizobium fredii CCBAU 45436]|nr:hypothetical protein AB395_00003917 [Sinorhizobium fredii CCBAU 45436]
MHRNVQYAKDRPRRLPRGPSGRWSKAGIGGRYRKANIQTGMYVNFRRGATRIAAAECWARKPAVAVPLGLLLLSVHAVVMARDPSPTPPHKGEGLAPAAPPNVIFNIRGFQSDET